jgi:hypothetical protein
MALHPRKAFALTSPLAPLEVSERLSNAIAEPAFRAWHDEGRPFTGRFDGTSFDVMRTSRGRNSFRPRIRGAIEPLPGGSRIHGTMQLHEVVLVFMGFLVVGPLWLFAQLFIQSVQSGHWDLRIFIVPAAVIGLLAVMSLAFVHESRRALTEFAAVVNGELSSRRS